MRWRTSNQQDHGLRHERYGMRHERHEALLSVTIRHERHVCVALRHEASRDTNKKASKASRCVTERHERHENVTKRYDASRSVTILSVTSVTKVVSIILQDPYIGFTTPTLYRVRYSPSFQVELYTGDHDFDSIIDWFRN